MNKTKQDTIQLVKKYSAVTMLLFFVLLNSLFTPNFFRLSNLNNIITQICPTILCGMGMTLVISTGGIDISDTGLLPAILAAVAVSVMVGCFTGFMV